MVKYLALVSLIILVFVFFPRRLRTTKLSIKNRLYNLEIASSLSQKAKGLSHRTFLCSNCGMIFTFSTEAIHPFWMKNTLIPLDIIWLDQQGRVVTIITGQPNDQSPLQNTSPAKYVIELNAGDTQGLGLKIGDIIGLPAL